MAAERLPDHGRERLVGLLAAGDPDGEVQLTWHAKEVVRQIYDHTDPELADAWVDDIGRDFADREMPARGPPPRPHHHALARPDRGLASTRTCRNGPTEAVILWSADVGVVDVADEATRRVWGTRSLERVVEVRDVAGGVS